MSDFAPPWWLRSPHLQTVWGRLTRRRRLVPFRREVLPLPDGDDLVLDHVDAPAPRLHFILMHGLEGSSYSVYIQGVLSILAPLGHAATVINFRSCARDPERIFTSLPNRRPRFYHSGDTADFDVAVRTLAARHRDRTFVAFGASLGGNVLLKWLGENGAAPSPIVAAATLSVPFDLGAGAAFLESRAGRFYVASFLRSLKRKVRELAQRDPDAVRHLDLARMERAQTFREFDDAATAPLHGFTGADDYYLRSSSIHYLGRITTPTLCISAEDDPFLPREALQRAIAAASPAVEFRTTQFGGHTGFVGGTPLRPRYWAEERIVEWLVARAAGAVAA